MSPKSDANEALDKFIHHIGVPSEILTDGPLELHKSQWGKTCVKHSIMQSLTEPDTPKQNTSELQGRILKKRVHDKMRSANIQIICLGFNRLNINLLSFPSVNASMHIMNDGATASESIFGHTPHIPEKVQYK